MMPSRPPTLDTLTMTPCPRASIRGRIARVSRIGAKKLTRMTASTSSGASASTTRRFGVAALLTSTSMPPNSSQARNPSSPTVPVSARSATHIVEAGEVLRQSASTSARRSGRRAISPTTAPWPASRRARAAPMPDDAPVMTTRFPATEYAMAKAWREWPVVTWVSAICVDKWELGGVVSSLYWLSINSASCRGVAMARTDDDTWDLASSVGATATMVAAARAMASKTEQPLINDPFAEPLVRAVGLDLFTRLATGELTPADLEDDSDGSPPGIQRMTDNMAVRTKFFDEFFIEATNAGIKQAVILASGLDARAYRLPWPAGTTVYEIDQPQVIEFKSRTLAELGAQPTAHRRAVAIDLRDDWPAALRAEGFDPDAPSAWSAEGLLGYLPPDAQDRLLDTITALSAPGSRIATESGPTREPGHEQRIKERMRTVSQRWGKHGLDLDMTELVYFGDRNEASVYLSDHGWQMGGSTIREMFAANGLPPIEEDDLPFADRLYVSGTLTDKK